MVVDLDDRPARRGRAGLQRDPHDHPALLTSEVVGAILVTVLSVVILAKVIFSHGPSGQTFTLNFLAPP